MRVQGIRRDLSYPKNSCLKRHTTVLDGPYEEVPAVHTPCFKMHYTLLKRRSTHYGEGSSRSVEWAGDVRAHSVHNTFCSLYIIGRSRSLSTGRFGEALN
jgi:hypothetical protein